MAKVINWGGQHHLEGAKPIRCSLGDTYHTPASKHLAGLQYASFWVRDIPYTLVRVPGGGVELACMTHTWHMSPTLIVSAPGMGSTSAQRPSFRASSPGTPSYIRQKYWHHQNPQHEMCPILDMGASPMRRCSNRYHNADCGLEPTLALRLHSKGGKPALSSRHLRAASSS